MRYFVLLSFALTFVCLGVLSQPLSAASLAIGDPAPSIGSIKSLNSADGAAIDINNYRGKVILIDFWATWCGPCVSSIPHVEGLHKKYGKQGLVVIGHTDASSRGLEDMIKSKGMTYLISIGANIGDDYGVTGIPRVFLVDSKGNVAWTGHPGALQDATIEQLLADFSDFAKTGSIPQFPKASISLRVAKVEEKIAAGKVGSGLSELEKMIEKDRDASAAQATIDQVKKWQEIVEQEITSVSEAGDVFRAYALNDLMSDLLKGHDSADVFKERLKALKNDEQFKAGKDFQKFLSVTGEQKNSASFERAVRKFIDKYESGYYVDQARTLIE